MRTGAEKLGTVSFETSCSAAAQPQFNRAVALLHSFEFGRAIEAFSATLTTDPSCAMAEWGIALSRWGNPFAPGIRPAAVLQQGREAVDSANRIGPKTDRERAYVDAVARLYRHGERRINPRASRRTATRWKSLRRPIRTTREGRIFYALSIAAAASPNDKTFADQLKAGAILESLIAAQPNHPGLAHYIIHSYDVPPLADRALAAARRYAAIAPSAPHALHMPSHTFTRLGYWQDSIDTNIKSGEVAKRERSVAEELHTMDYRVYAYLQTGQDRSARQLLESLPDVRSRFDPDAIGSAAPGSAGVFALAAIPARYALERGAWADAAKLEAHPGKYPYTRSAHPLRPRARCRADRRRRDGSLLDRGVAANPAAAHDGEGTLLGRAGRDSAPRRDGMARVRGTSRSRRPCGNARGRDAGGRHRKGGGDARTVGTRARTARRDAVATG